MPQVFALITTFVDGNLPRKFIEPNPVKLTYWIRRAFPHDVKPRDQWNTYATGDVKKVSPEKCTLLKDLRVDEMTSRSEASEEVPQGLDRAPLGTYMPFEKHEPNGGLNFPSKADKARKDESVAPGEFRGMNKLRRLSKRLRVRVRQEMKEGSGIHNDQRTFDATTLAPTLAPAPPPTTQNDRFSGEVPEKPRLPPLKEFVTKPMDTIVSLAHTKGGNDFAENVANTDVSHGASVNLVLAHERITALPNDRERLKATQDFEMLKKARQDSLVRWTMDRHIQRVKAVQAQRVPWLDKRDFFRKDGRMEKMNWLDYVHHLLAFYLQQHGGRYIGVSSELPEPTESALISSFERVLLTSTPVQNMLMKLASIAFWESPVETAAYAVLYIILCVFNYVTRAVILYVLYTTVRARFYPPTIPDLREKLERSEDTERTAQDLTELIEQQGPHGWVDPLIKKAGPTIQLQLEDLANFMEILKNFHEWREPRRSGITLVVLFFLWLMITLTPVWLLVKESFFAIGIAFFVFIPISHRWPQYRLLVSPLTWLFWKIPTHGEWAIARLQAEAAQHLQKLPRAASTVDVKDFPVAEEPFVGPMADPRITQNTTLWKNGARKEAIRVGRYHCTSANLHGNLCLDTEGVHFEMHLTASEKWRLKYADLKSVLKIVGSSTISSGEDILFIDMRDKEYRVSALKLRDEVFTQIIGYSGLEWQITG